VDTVPKATLPKPVTHSIEIIKNRLFWYSGPKPPTSNSEAYFFSVDEELLYDPFNEDFGPLSLA
jgi:cell division cycle 14